MFSLHITAMAIGVLVFRIQEALSLLELTKRLPPKGPGRVCAPSKIPFGNPSRTQVKVEVQSLPGRILLPDTVVRLPWGQNVAALQSFQL